MNHDRKVKKLITDEIEKVSHIIDTKLMKWVTNHIIEPRKIKVTINPDIPVWKEVWLVTDSNGNENSSYRIIFDPDINSFGLECALESGLNWYMGSYSSLSEAIKNM